MPLVWAHSEHIKLLRSLADGAVFDMPPQGVERYIKAGTTSNLRIWRFNNRLSVIPAGKTLRLELPASATVRWSVDDWTTVNDTSTVETGFEGHFVDLPTQDAAEGQSIVFTFLWLDKNQWENRNFTIRIGE
jgi:glucoamylase